MVRVPALGAVLSNITKLPSVPAVALIAVPVFPAESVIEIVKFILFPSSISAKVILYTADQIVLSTPSVTSVAEIEFPAIVIEGFIISSLKTIAKVTTSFVFTRLDVNVFTSVQFKVYVFAAGFVLSKVTFSPPVIATTLVPEFPAISSNAITNFTVPSTSATPPLPIVYVAE